MNTFLGILGIIWSSPYTILSYVLFSILKLTRQVEKTYWTKYLIATVDLRNEGWFCRILFSNRGWAGWTLGGMNFVVDTNNTRWWRTVAHECRHSLQYYWWGILFLPAYILASIFIFLFIPSKHSYYDNPFERDAREAAGQPVNIHKSSWSDGPNDRWAWW